MPPTRVLPLPPRPPGFISLHIPQVPGLQQIQGSVSHKCVPETTPDNPLCGRGMQVEKGELFLYPRLSASTEYGKTQTVQRDSPPGTHSGVTRVGTTGCARNARLESECVETSHKPNLGSLRVCPDLPIPISGHREQRSENRSGEMKPTG